MHILIRTSRSSSPVQSKGKAGRSSGDSQPRLLPTHRWAEAALLVQFRLPPIQASADPCRPPPFPMHPTEAS